MCTRRYGTVRRRALSCIYVYQPRTTVVPHGGTVCSMTYVPHHAVTILPDVLNRCIIIYLYVLLRNTVCAVRTNYYVRMQRDI